MSATTLTNGKPRKQLSDQLDRLDGILDALADGLPGAVADACREGARQAVKDAIIEVLTNPELRALITPVRPEPTPAQVQPTARITPLEPEFVSEPKKPGLWSRLKAKLAAVRNAVSGAARKTKDVVAAQCQAAGNAVAAVGQAAGEALPWKRMLWVSAGVGLTVGVICLVMPHVAAAVVGAVSAATTSIAVQTGNWLKKAAMRLGLI
jgi:hypothetical protein